jgi:hypothetical protein
MEFKRSLPHSQEPATCLYSEPDQYPVLVPSPPPHPSFLRSILILCPLVCQGLASGLLPSGFPTNTLCAPVLSSICATCPSESSWLGYPDDVWWGIQSIIWGPCVWFLTCLSLYGEELFAPRQTPPGGEPPLAGCPQLLIQYICSYPSYLEAVSPSTTWGRAMSWWQGCCYCVF